MILHELGNQEKLIGFVSLCRRHRQHRNHRQQWHHWLYWLHRCAPTHISSLPVVWRVSLILSLLHQVLWQSRECQPDVVCRLFWTPGLHRSNRSHWKQRNNRYTSYVCKVCKLRAIILKLCHIHMREGLAFGMQQVCICTESFSLLCRQVPLASLERLGPLASLVSYACDIQRSCSLSCLWHLSSLQAECSHRGPSFECTCVSMGNFQCTCGLICARRPTRISIYTSTFYPFHKYLLSAVWMSVRLYWGQRRNWLHWFLR